MDIPIGHIPRDEPEAYEATLLAHGLDTWVETFNVDMPDKVWREFEGAQKAARSMNSTGEDSAPCEFGGHIWHMRPWGGGGAKYILATPEITLSVRAKDMPWNLTARYSSAGLWLAGLEELQYEVNQSFNKSQCRLIGGLEASCTVSRFDYAFDFRCEEFTREARPEMLARFVQPVNSKAAVYTSGNGADIRAETFRVGKMPRLQIEVYDKGREIKEASHKEWMRDVWKLDDGDALENIWRIEARFGSEFLKDRSLRQRRQVEDAMPGILAAALVKRRLTMGNATRARRSDMHPLWSRAWQLSGDAQTTPGLDRRPILARKELIETLEKQMAGLVRAHSVLRHGAYADDAPEDAGRGIRDRIEADPAHARKVDRAQERYRFVDDAR